MSIAKQLYQLQGIELEIESNERALEQMTGRLGEKQVVVSVQDKLAQERKRLEELKKRQHDAEWEIDDIASKLAVAEEGLYSGRVKNPKELASLQHEVEGLKAKRNQLEDGALDIMDQVELVTTSEAAVSNELKVVEAGWRKQQDKLSVDIRQLEAKLSDLGRKRELMLARIDPQVAQRYSELRKQKQQAVAKVEQGTCGGCRISLPTAELQRVRSENLVQCSSCGRILFLA